MPNYDAIAAADYVIEGYVEAADELRRHRETGSETAIRRAASALCRSLTRLEDDGRFWDDIGRAETHTRRTGPDVVEDLDGLLTLERDVLLEAGVPRPAIEEILHEFVRSLERFDQWPDQFAVEHLRESVGTAARAACMEATFRTLPRPTGRLRRAARAAAGGVIVVADAIAAPVGLQELSIVIGGDVIIRSVRSRD